MLDALIVGAGPAGSSCALWLNRLGFSVLLADSRATSGGLLNDSPYINTWIATQPGMTGTDLAEGVGLSLAAAGVPLMLGATAVDIQRSEEGFTTEFDLGSRGRKILESRHLVLATGVRARTGGYQESDKVIIGPGERVFSKDFTGLRVAILGGGDNAFENHQFVKSRGAALAHLYARTLRAAHHFRQRVPSEDVTLGTVNVDDQNPRVNGKDYDVLLVMYGWQPNTELGKSLGVGLTPSGHAQVDLRTCETSVKNLYAIGEAVDRGHPCVVSAMADGVLAAKAIQRKIEAESEVNDKG